MALLGALVSLACSGALRRRSFACQARARTAKLEDFALNLRTSSIRLYGRAPSYLVEEQQRSAVLPSVSLYLSPDRQNKVISLSWSPHGHLGPISSKVTTPKTRLSKTALQSPSSASASERSRWEAIAGRTRDYVDPLRSG